MCVFGTIKRGTADSLVLIMLRYGRLFPLAPLLGSRLAVERRGPLSRRNHFNLHLQLVQSRYPSPRSVPSRRNACKIYDLVSGKKFTSLFHLAPSESGHMSQGGLGLLRARTHASESHTSSFFIAPFDDPVRLSRLAAGGKCAAS